MSSLWWTLEVLAIMKVSRWIWQNKDCALIGEYLDWCLEERYNNYLFFNYWIPSMNVVIIISRIFRPSHFTYMLWFRVSNWVYNFDKSKWYHFNDVYLLPYSAYFAYVVEFHQGSSSSDSGENVFFGIPHHFVYGRSSK